MAAAARDIPQSSTGRDNLTVVAAKSDAATVMRPPTLPTPPNSISPALPAHGLKAQLQRAKLEPIDSDLDLHEDGPGPQRSVSPFSGASGGISSAMLAKNHLPEILLNHGPLAIRHIMGYLTASVPGFSTIPPTKARRLIVGALEGRGGERGGVDGEVEYEKVGWGRWNARRRGQLTRDALIKATTPPGELSGGIPISRNALRAHDRRTARALGTSRDSIQFSHDDRHSGLEHDADNMSMDGYESASCSEAPDDDIVMNDDPEDVTDDEDWAEMGAAALRAESFSASVGAPFSPSGKIFPNTYTSGLRSMSLALPPQIPGIDLSALGSASGDQEREAVEALLRLGSV